MHLSLDRQVATERCPSCDEDFTVVRGSVYDSGRGVGLYLIALHGYTPEGRIAHLAVAVLDDAGAPHAAALELRQLPTEFGFTFVDWAGSPWGAETYLGRQLDRDQVLNSALKPLILHIAEHVTTDLPGVRAYFA